MKKKNLFISSLLLVVIFIFCLPGVSPNCFMQSSQLINCCADANAAQLDDRSFKREYRTSTSYTAVETGAGDHCQAFNISQNGTCYNKEASKYTYDYCIDSSHVVECFLIGRYGLLNDQEDYSVTTTSYGFPNGIPCPPNYLCPKGGKSCVPKKRCAIDSDCSSCMSCNNGYCSYNNSKSCTGCSGGECMCTWGVCENAACTASRLNSFDCTQCTDLSGDCGRCCEERDVTARCVRETSCVGGEAPLSECGGSCEFGMVCCEQSTFRGFIKKTCDDVISSACGTCCPHVTIPCEDRTQGQCSIETTQCSWCSDEVTSSCVNITSSNSFCGSCTNACGEDYVCTNRACVFSPPECGNRENQGNCTQYAATDDCEWCPVPTGTNTGDFSNYPYFMPGQEEDMSSVCVNTSFDPLNCGGCGFDATPGGFCTASAPFCNNGVCASGTAVSVSTYVNALHSAFPVSVNEFYSPYPVLTDAQGGEKADFASVNYAYAVSDADSYAAACTFAGGTWTAGAGCCGDNKCRSSGSSFCQVDKICDGTSWHTASQNIGEVFRPSSCFNTFPIANINGEFVKCIDTGSYDSYVSKVSQSNINGCVQTGATGANEGLAMSATGSLQYSCPAGYYVNSVVVSSGSCALQSITATTSGYLVCLPSQSTRPMGFASILANTPTLSFQQSYSSCPAPISSWKNSTGGEIIAQEQAFIPCPGMKTVENALPSGTQFSLALTGLSGDRSYTAAFCAQGISTQQDSGETGLYALDFVRSDGTIMGAVNGHSYACFTPAGSAAQIAVCCGNDAACLSNPLVRATGSGGMTYSTGQFITVSGDRRFCTSGGAWSDDLDSPGLQDMCTSAGKSATGNYCCSEADDVRAGGVNESYNDLNSPTGACLKGTFQNNNRTVRYNNQDYANIYVKNGTFYGCGFSATFNPETTGICSLDANGRLRQTCLESIQNWPNPGSTATPSPAQALVQRSNFCTIIKSSTEERYCAFDNTWTSTGGRDLSVASIVPAPLMAFLLSSNPGLVDRGCCQPGECWNPAAGQCIASQSGAGQGTYDYALPDGSALYRCVNGAWQNIMSMAKKAPYTCEIGYCPRTYDCLYDPRGNVYDDYNVSGTPQCLANGQFKGDYLCENGVWTSRTKKLALKMISMVPHSSSEGYFTQPFTLMCSLAPEVLVSEDSKRVVRNSGFQNPGSTNSYCVLEFDDNRIIGATLNQNLTSLPGTDFMYSLEYSFLRVYPNATTRFSHTCTPSTTNFARCINNPLLKLYYDNTFKMAIFSAQDFNSYMSTGLGDAVCTAITNSWLSWLNWLCVPPSQLEENLKNRQLFNRVYVSRQHRVDAYGQPLTSFSEIFGVAEGNCDADTQAFAQMYSFNYTGLPSTTDLNYLFDFTEAEDKTISHYPLNNNLFNIYLKNPTNENTWVALTLLRNTGQK